MTRERSTDERISAWLLEEAPDQLPDRVLQATFERTRPTRQRRTFLGWRYPSMSRLSPVAIAVGAAAIVIVVVGVALRPEQPPVGASPSASLTPSASAAESLRPITLTGQIAFERTVDANKDIYLMNLDRSGYVRLTDDPAADLDPAWSPDGQRILFLRVAGGSSDLFVMNSDGTGQTQLTADAAEEDAARFSPDGTTIGFWRVTGTSSELWLMEADGSNERLVETFGVFVGGLGWNADASAILFNRDLNPGGGNIDIASIDLTTKEVTAVADERGDDSTFAVSYDGSMVAFQSDRSPGGLFVMEIDGSNVRHVNGTWTDGHPVAWSPDGARLVFPQAGGWLWLVRIDGTELVKWTEGGPGVAWRPQP